MNSVLTRRAGGPCPGGRPGEVAGGALAADGDPGRGVPVAPEALPLRTREGEIAADGHRRVLA